MIAFRALPVCLALAAGLAWGQDYDVSFGQAARVGATKVNPGKYKLKVQGAVVILTDPATNKSVTTLAQVDKMEKPAAYTLVQGSALDGVEQVEQIVIAGASFKLRFGK